MHTVLAPFRWAGLALAVLSAPAAPATEPELSPARVAILETAHEYANVRWVGEERHVMHGDDASGVRVDTPDASLDPAGWRPGEEAVGMPYCWGGFTSLADFEAELAADRWAGHVPRRGNAMSSARTLGVDCSGFVSRAWNLPVKQSTRSLGRLCTELDGYDELLPGDAVNRFDAHVALFTGWEDDARTVMRVIEAARLRVEESTYPVERLRAQDFRPMRYLMLDEGWRPMPAEPPPSATSVDAGARRAFTAADGEPLDGDPLPPSLREGATPPGAWARYDATESGLEGPHVRATWMAAESGPAELRLQRRLDVGEAALASEATLDLGERWPALLVAFANFSDPLQDFEVVESRLETGTYAWGDHALDARRLTAVVEARNLSRSTLYPARIELACVLSDAVPLLGVCEATFALEIEYGRRGEDRIIGGAEHRFALTAFGGE